MSQTFDDFEVVVYDDSSTDETVDVMTAIRDRRVRFFRQPRNVGIARNRNSCLEVARGQYVAWLDSDDLYLPGMLAAQSAVLDRHASVGLVHGAFGIIDAAGKPLSDCKPSFDRDMVESGCDVFAELALCNYICTPTVMVRRACYDRVGQYAVELGNFSEDWEMWLRIALHFDVAFTAAPVAKCRWHDHRISTETARAGHWTRAEMQSIQRVFRLYGGIIPNMDRLRRQAYAALAAKALLRSREAGLRGQRRLALYELVSVFRVAPWLLQTCEAWLLLAGTAGQSEMLCYRYSKILLNLLYNRLAGTRYGESIRKQAEPNPQWDRILDDVARTVRRIVPTKARLAVVDKWDPTLLVLSGRKGWHFPDLELSPDGYPADSECAIAHLEQLMIHGADYLVFPSAAFWWLDYYDGFRQYLDGCHQRLWNDDQCVIYHLLGQNGKG